MLYIKEINQRLHQNALAYGIDRRRGFAPEGPALLQSQVVCGICGNRMIYWRNKGLIQGCRCDDRNQWLYLPPSHSLTMKQKTKKTFDHRPLDKKSLETIAGGAV
jgi:hypothetical protein